MSLRTSLRASVYGALAVALVGLGCNLKSCSCKALTLPGGGLLGKGSSKKKVFSDVEMLSEGAEPRVELRVARWPGFKYRVVLESSGSLAFEGQPAAFGPTIVMTLDHEVLRGGADPILVPRDGGIEERIEERVMLESLSVRQDGVAPEVLDGWNQLLRPFHGSSMRQQVTGSAAIATMKTELVGGVKPPEALRQAIDASLDGQRHFPFRLPPTPVGIGARWRFREDIVINGVTAAQVADMTLKGLDGNAAVVGIALLQHAPRQTVPHPLVPGQTAVLEQFRGDGEGELLVDRLTAIPLRGRLVGASRLTVSGEVNGQHGVATLVGSTVMLARSSVIGEGDAGAAKP